MNLEQGKHNLVIENIKVALAEIQLHAITANDVHIPFKSSDDIYYEAVFEI